MAATAPELRQEIESRREAIDRDLAQLGDKVSPSKAMRRTADRTVSGGRDRLSSIKSAVMGRVETVQAKTDELGSSVGGARDQVRTRTEGSPFGAGLAAFGLGLVVAAVWPTTEVERRAASAVEELASEKVRETARAEGEALVEELKEPAREAIGAVEEKATEAAQSVASSASAGGAGSDKGAMSGPV